MSSSNGKIWLISSFLSFFLLIVGCGKKNPVKKDTHVPRIAKAYVTSNDHLVSVFDLERVRRIKDIPVGRVSIGVAITPDYNYAYVTCYGPGEVYKVKVNVDTTVGSIKMEGNPGGIVISGDGARAYVANTGPDSKSISVINLESDTVESTIGLSEPPNSIVLTSDGSKILAALLAGNVVLVIDAQNYNIIDQIGIDEPGYIAISCDGNYAYVTSGSSNYISQMSLSTFTEIRSFRVGDYPMGVVENPINGDLLVSNGIPNDEPLGNILVLDSSFVAQDTIAVNGLPTAMVFSHDGTNLWVTVGVSGGVSLLYLIDPESYTTRDSLAVYCGWPMDLAIVPGESGGEPAQPNP